MQIISRKTKRNALRKACGNKRMKSQWKSFNENMCDRIELINFINHSEVLKNIGCDTSPHNGRYINKED